KLLAQKAIHKAAAAHLAAIFEAAQGNQQFAPFEREFLAQSQFPKYHSLALSIASPEKSSDQRPVLWRGRALRPFPWPARRLGSMRARRLSKPSAVKSPAATS